MRHVASTTGTGSMTTTWWNACSRSVGSLTRESRHGSSATCFRALNDTRETIVADPDPELRALLFEQREKMEGRIAFLEQNLDALDRYIAAMDRASADEVSLT